MAQVSKDFTNDQSRFLQVVYQRGKNVIDGEMNDGQRLRRVSQYRKALTEMGVLGASAATASSVPTLYNLNVTPGGNPGQVILGQLDPSYEGLIALRGYVFAITAPVSVQVDESVPLIANQFQQIYLRIQEEEITAAQDPTIVTAQLGETAVRQKLRAEVLVGAVDTTTAETEDATTAEPYAANGTVRTGILAIVHRGTASANIITPAEITQVFRFPGGAERWRRSAGTPAFHWVETSDSTLDGASRAKVAWDKVAAKLQFTSCHLVVQPGQGVFSTPQVPIEVRVAGAFDLATEGDCLVVVIPTQMREGSDGYADNYVASDAQVYPMIPGRVFTYIGSWDDYSAAKEIGTPAAGTHWMQNEHLHVIVAVRLRDSDQAWEDRRFLFLGGKYLSVRKDLHPLGMENPDADGTVFLAKSPILAQHPKRIIPDDAGQIDIPFWRTTDAMRVVDEQLQLVRAHAISHTGDPLNGTGATIWYREYVGRTWLVTRRDEPTGNIVSLGTATEVRISTINARYLPGQPDVTKWLADDNTKSAELSFRGNTAGVVGSFHGGATQVDTSSAWPKLEWKFDPAVNGSVLHWFKLASGALFGFGKDAIIAQYQRLGLNLHDNPTQVGGGTTPPQRNSLYAGNIAKAWGRVTFNPALPPTVENEFGVTSVTVATNEELEITFSVPFVSITAFNITGQIGIPSTAAQNGRAIFPQIRSRAAANKVRFEFRNISETQENITLFDGVTFDFTAFGDQAAV